MKKSGSDAGKCSCTALACRNGFNVVGGMCVEIVADENGAGRKYREQCAATGQKIEQKHIIKLNSYARDPENCVVRSQKSKYHIKSGTQLIKKYKGREHIVTATGPGEFKYNDMPYRTLSAIACEICGHKVSGYDFFGFRDKNKAKNMV